MAVDWTLVLHSLIRLPGALTVAVGMSPFSVSLPLFPTLCFLWLWPQLIPTMRNRPQGLLVWLDGRRGSHLKSCELSEKLASEIRSHGGGGCGSWDAQGHKRDSLDPGLLRDQKVTDETQNKHGRLFRDFDYSLVRKEDPGIWERAQPGLAAPALASLFCLLLSPALGALALRG